MRDIINHLFDFVRFSGDGGGGDVVRFDFPVFIDVLYYPPASLFFAQVERRKSCVTKAGFCYAFCHHMLCGDESFSTFDTFTMTFFGGINYVFVIPSPTQLLMEGLVSRDNTLA